MTAATDAVFVLLVYVCTAAAILARPRARPTTERTDHP